MVCRERSLAQFAHVVVIAGQQSAHVAAEGAA